MSLVGALNIGKTALAVHQAAIQVTSNNVANAGNADYTRQSAHLTPMEGQQLKPGVFIGGGVNIDSVQRQIDDALTGRLRGAISDKASANERQQWVGSIESIFQELGDNGISSQLSQFFNGWSNLANKPQDIGLRQIVVQNGEALASSLRGVRQDMTTLQDSADKQIQTLATNVDSLAQQVADLNLKIAQAEAGAGQAANSLRDQRDVVLKSLSELVEVRTQETSSGMVNVLSGSNPLVLGSDNRGVSLKFVNDNGTLVPTLIIKEDNSDFIINSGRLGALVGLQTDIKDVVSQVDSLAGNLIFELNNLHASGQGLAGLSQMTGGNGVNDTTKALNTVDAGLEFAPKSGSFVVMVKQKSSGLTNSTLVKVDLDGLNADDTTLDSLQASLSAIPGITASISAGKLTIKANSSDTEVSFSQDSSGTLAALGINAFFTGKNARDIAINAAIKTQPTLLAASKNGQAGDNQTALAIADLESKPLDGLQGVALKDKYQAMINGIAVSASSAKTNAEAAATVQETLENQREALSGVSLDEEAINLMREQRAFQGAARIISTVDELMKVLMALT
jgi:flagellar hook-associated protein 1 FlgK